MTSQAHMADVFRPELGELAEIAAARMFAHIKASTLEHALTHGRLMVTFDARLAGEGVPAHLRAACQVTIRIGDDLNPPIPDLAFLRDDLVATLTFDGRPYRCAIPWAAVFAVRFDQGPAIAVWESSIPAELLTGPPQAEVEPEPERPRPKLSLVP